MAFRPLSLTSPLLHGEDVKEAQRRLSHSRFGNFRPGSLDGEFGEKSAAATRRAKRWLGYPASKINGVYGPRLHAYLGGKRLPLSYRLRRRKRLELKRQHTPLRLRALRVAKSQLGVNENPPNTNIVRYSVWYGLTGPWCAMFVTWCYVQAGCKVALKQGERYAFVPFILSDANAGRNAMRRLTWEEAAPGDLVLYQFDADSSPDHIGLLEAKIDGDSFDAIEGNTSITSEDDGGEVMRRRRTRSQVIAYVRIEA